MTPPNSSLSFVRSVDQSARLHVQESTYALASEFLSPMPDLQLNFPDFKRLFLPSFGPYCGVLRNKSMFGCQYFSGLRKPDWSMNIQVYPKGMGLSLKLFLDVQ